MILFNARLLSWTHSCSYSGVALPQTLTSLSFAFSVPSVEGTSESSCGLNSPRPCVDTREDTGQALGGP